MSAIELTCTGAAITPPPPGTAAWSAAENGMAETR